MNTVNVNVEPLCPTDTLGALPPTSATGPELDVTVTFTLLPGLTLAERGLTDVISALAGPIPTRKTASAAASGRIPRNMREPGPLNARDLIDRTMAPNDLDDVRRIRHSS